ncbi:MAG: flagellar filament capping protein FliD [Planctomycetota bacterium]
MPRVDGLVSGLDTTSIIQQLVELSRRPLQQLEERVVKKEEQKTAIQGLTAKLLDLKLTGFKLTKASTYRVNEATSSNESILRASATSGETTGSFSFRVARLARNAQAVSQGMPNASTTAVGAGKFTVEMGGGFVDHSTKVSELNDGQGFERGSIRITDGNGASKVIDLSLAVTVDDILAAINQEDAIQVMAEAWGDGIRLTDQSGGGSLTVAEVNGGLTASSLGLLRPDVAGVIEGSDINGLSLSTRIDRLNDGLGVRSGSGDDLAFTTSSGASFQVDIGSPSTLQDVVDAINNDADNVGKVTASLDTAGKGLVLVDNTVESGGTFTVSAVAGPFGTSGALVDLGLHGLTSESAATGASDAADGTILRGKRLVASLNTLLGRTLNGGQKEAGTQGLGNGTIQITDRQGNTASIVLDPRRETSTTVDPALGATSLTLASVAGMAVGNRIRISDGTNTEYRILTDVDQGTNVVSFTEGLSFDFAAASAVYGLNETLGDVVNAINNNTDVNVTARFNRELNGLRIDDNNTGLPTSDLSIVDTVGTVANDLGIRTGVSGAHAVSVGGSTTQLTSATLAALGLEDDQLNGLELLFTAGANAGQKQTIKDFDATTGQVTFDSGFSAVIGAADTFTITGTDSNSFNGFDSRPRYLSRNTLLADMNAGRGVFGGKFQVTDRNGDMFTVNIEGKTDLGQVIDQINGAALAAGSDLSATINDDGNGLLVSSPTGTGSIRIVDINGGTSASDLNILANTTSATVDGSFEFTIDLDGTESLNDIRDILNNLNLDITTTIIHDGSATAPYRLNIVSNVAGSPGRLLMDDFDNSFNFTTTTQAQDAAVIFGGGSSGSQPVLITGTSNTVENIIPGLTLTLGSASSEMVTVNISRNVDGILESIRDFVEGFNASMEEIHELSDFKGVDAEEPAILQGNAALRNIEADLYRTFTRSVQNVTAPFNRLSSVGLRVKEDGTGLDFDEDKFRSAINSHYEDVVTLLDAGAKVGSNTRLAELRGGQGVRQTSGSDDIEITMTDGTTLRINLDNMDTVAEVIAAINNHTSNPGTLTASLRVDGEGIQLTDTTGGTGPLRAININGSNAATDLGIFQSISPSGSSAVIKGFSLRDAGAFAMLNSRLAAIVESNGVLTGQSEAIDKTIETMRDQMIRIEERVQREQERLFMEFSHLESVLSDLQGQSSFISQQLGRR